MPRVFIPPLLRPLTDGVEQLDVEGGTVRQVIDNMETRYPGIRGRLCDGDELKPGLVVSVDGRIRQLGLLQKLGEDSEVHFLPAVGGG